MKALRKSKILKVRGNRSKTAESISKQIKARRLWSLGFAFVNGQRKRS